MPVIFPPEKKKEKKEEDEEESAAAGHNFPDIPRGRCRNAALYRNSAPVDLAKGTLNPAPTLDLFY